MKGAWPDISTLGWCRLQTLNGNCHQHSSIKKWYADFRGPVPILGECLVELLAFAGKNHHSSAMAGLTIMQKVTCRQCMSKKACLHAGQAKRARLDQQPAGMAFDMDSEEAALTAAALVCFSTTSG
jgi:hypothetical protein